MLRIRIAAAGAFVLILLFTGALVAGGAVAQTATGATPGKPLQLLNIVERSQQTSKSHPKAAVKTSRHTKFAARRIKPRHTMAQAAPPTAPVPATEALPADVAIASPAPPPASAPADQTTSEVVVGGQTVQVASSNEANEIDLAAKGGAPQGANDPAQSVASINALPMHDSADVEPKANAPQVVTVQPTPTKVGSTSWFLQVMAALGGAVTAGSLAWFLIGSTPQRTYG
jgi:hypothetical protein